MAKESGTVADPTLGATSSQNRFFRPINEKLTKIPPWLDHFNRKDLKTLCKCSIAVWVYTLFIFINPTLRALGQATFFGAIVLFIAPPSGVVAIAVLVGGTLVIGVCLGWAWGTITMKSALATRPAADLQARYVALQQMATQNTTNSQQASGQSTFTQIAVYQGFFLDTRVSVTYFCMIGLFIYLISRLRVKAPKLALVSMFSMIICDIYLTIAPLIPTFQGTIPQVLIKPAAIATGISIVCNIFIFPRSTSHIILDDMQALLKPINEFLQACMIDLKDADIHFDADRLQESREASIALYRGLEANLGFLSLDASMGRFSANDIKTISKPLRRVMVTFLGLSHLQHSRARHKVRDKRLLRIAGVLAADKESELSSAEQAAEKSNIEQDAEDVSFEKHFKPNLKSLVGACSDMLPACEDAITAVVESLHECNTRRWISKPSKEECDQRHKSHAAVLAKLKTHSKQFSDRNADNLWENYRHHFDAEGRLLESRFEAPVSPLGALMLSLVLEERILDLALALEALLECIVDLEERCTTTRLWLPGNIQKFFAWAFHDDSDPAQNISISDSSSQNTLVEPASPPSKGKKDPHAKQIKEAVALLTRPKPHGGRQRNKGGQLLLFIYRWFTSTEAMFGLRVLVATIAIGVIGVIPSSAGFFYREKGLWALIMAQTALVPYTADFVFGFITRLTGTVAGAVIGLVAWYIGAGNGPGNPYGMAAIMALVIIGLMWLRLFTSPALLQGIVITAATCYLVVGYSWADTHIPSYGNPGVGYSVFWRRMLLVMIGFGVAAFVTLFPRPPSANRHYRRLLSEALATIQHQYGIATVITTQDMDDLEEIAEQAAISLGGALLEIEPTIALTKLEFSSSNFDSTTLQHVCRLCMTLNYSATQLMSYVPQLSAQLKERFVTVSAITQDRTISDVMMALALAQQSLKSGDALPPILPFLSSIRRQQHRQHLKTATTADGKNVSDIVFTRDLLAEEGMRKYCTTMVAYVQFLGSIDELLHVIKKAVGESGNAQFSQDV